MHVHNKHLSCLLSLLLTQWSDLPELFHDMKKNWKPRTLRVGYIFLTFRALHEDKACPAFSEFF